MIKHQQWSMILAGGGPPKIKLSWGPRKGSGRLWSNGWTTQDTTKPGCGFCHFKVCCDHVCQQILSLSGDGPNCACCITSQQRLAPCLAPARRHDHNRDSVFALTCLRTCCPSPCVYSLFSGCLPATSFLQETRTLFPGPGLH